MLVSEKDLSLGKGKAGNANKSVSYHPVEDDEEKFENWKSSEHLSENSLSHSKYLLAKKSSSLENGEPGDVIKSMVVNPLEDVEEKMENWKSSEHLTEESLTRTKYLKRMGRIFKTNWMEYCSYTLLALFIQMLLWGFRYSIFEKDFEKKNHVCEIDPITNNKEAVCELQEGLSKAREQYRVLAAFIIGGFVQSCVGLWRTRRTAYCALCGATRNLIINICSILPTNEQDKILMQTRSTLGRWCVLGYELAVLKARGQIDSFEGYRYLKALNVIDEDEWEKMVDGDRHTTVWWWIQYRCRELADEGTINWKGFQQISNAVTLSRDKANDLMSKIDRDQPVPYVHVCAALVNFNLFFFSLASGVEWAIWMVDTEGKVWFEPKMYIDILMQFCYTTMFAVLFDLCTVLYNPFGPRYKLDIPHKKVGSGIRELAKNLSKCVSNLPRTMEPNWKGDSTKGERYAHKHEVDASINMAEDNLFKHMNKKSFRLGRSVLIGGMEDFSKSL